MRKMAVEVFALAVVLGMVCVGHGQPAPTDKPKDDKTKKAPQKSKLEEMLEQALQSNPDVRVAEAKVREAEAKLNQTRLAVTQKVATLYASLDAAKQAVEVAEADLAGATKRFESGRITVEEYMKSRHQVAIAKAELAKLQAEVPYLVGKRLGEESASTDKAIENGLRWLGHQHLIGAMDRESMATSLALLALREASLQKAAGPMSDRVRKALDKPVTLDYRKKSGEAVLKDLFEKADLPVHFRAKTASEVSLISKEPLTLGAALQLYQDLADDGVRFVVRDYGVLVTDAKLPPGAVLLHDFWKSKLNRLIDPTKPDAEGKNPPPENVEGTVKEVDKGGLIKISIGSDAGLKKGHTLEVYRVNDKAAKYLGRVRVIEVSAKEAVAQPVGKLTGDIEKGDRVASKISGN
jgi:hypothetical protein